MAKDIKELGKCYAKTNDGRIRAFKEGKVFRLYLVGRKMMWSADNELLGFSKTLEAIETDVYFRDLENFMAAVYELQCELNSLMKNDLDAFVNGGK